MMGKTTRIREHSVICDASVNPPTTCEDVLVVRVMVQFEDQPADSHFVVDLPIGLAELRENRLVVRGAAVTAPERPFTAAPICIGCRLAISTGDVVYGHPGFGLDDPVCQACVDRQDKAESPTPALEAWVGEAPSGGAGPQREVRIRAFDSGTGEPGEEVRWTADTVIRENHLAQPVTVHNPGGLADTLQQSLAELDAEIAAEARRVLGEDDGG